MIKPQTLPIAFNRRPRLGIDIRRFKGLIEEMSLTGPTEPQQYVLLNRFFQEVSRKRKSNELLNRDIRELRGWFRGAMETDRTLQGHVCLKPRGYDGDYVIIDRIYKNHLSEKEVFRNWDKYFQSGDAPKAVRNRKKYFIKTLNDLKEGARVLNLASGPCRDLLEYANQSKKKLTIHNLELDPRAVKFAKELLRTQETLETHFLCQNIFKFSPSEKYDLIWSAGLFDYFEDKVFVGMLKRFSRYVKRDGMLIIGNFNKGLRTKDYMEFGDWFLNYRSGQELLALSAFLEENRTTVEREELNVNLFLKIRF